MKNLLYATAALVALAVSPAKADTFTVNSFSQPNGAQDVSFTFGPLTRTVSAGEIDIHQNIPAMDILVWCLDVKDTLNIPYTYTVNTFGPGSIVGALPGLPAGGLDAAQLRQIASLMLKGLTVGGADVLQDDAATQLAIWSVEYANAGGISFNGLSAPLSSRLALLLLDSANGGIIDCPTCSLTILTDAIEAPNQALGFAVNAVPGPVVGAGIPGAIAAGMFMVGLAKRRRQRIAAV